MYLPPWLKLRGGVVERRQDERAQCYTRNVLHVIRLPKEGKEKGEEKTSLL